MSGEIPVDEQNGAREGERAGYLLLFWTFLRMHFLLMFRYKLDFVGRLLGIYLFFAVVFFGGKAVFDSAGGAGSLGSTLDALIVGWFLWTMAQSAYGNLSSEVNKESRWGTLEQLYMSPHGFGVIMTMKVVVNLCISLFLGSVMFVLMIFTTGRTLTVDVITIGPIIVLTLMSVLGIGFVFAGLALVYKQIGNFSSLFQFVIVGLIAAPAAGIPATKILPLVQGSSMLQETMLTGSRLWEFSGLDLLILVVIGVAYLLVGLQVFRLCSHVARKRGVMGHY